MKSYLHEYNYNEREKERKRKSLYLNKEFNESRKIIFLSKILLLFHTYVKWIIFIYNLITM